MSNAIQMPQQPLRVVVGNGLTVADATRVVDTLRKRHPEVNIAFPPGCPVLGHAAVDWNSLIGIAGAVASIASCIITIVTTMRRPGAKPPDIEAEIRTTFDREITDSQLVSSTGLKNYVIRRKKECEIRVLHVATHVCHVVAIKRKGSEHSFDVVPDGHD